MRFTSTPVEGSLSAWQKNQQPQKFSVDLSGVLRYKLAYHNFIIIITVTNFLNQRKNYYQNLPEVLMKNHLRGVYENKNPGNIL